MTNPTPNELRELARRVNSHYAASCTVERDYDAFARFTCNRELPNLIIALCDRLERAEQVVRDERSLNSPSLDLMPTNYMTTPLAPAEAATKWNLESVG